MPTNLNALIRYKTIDTCLRNRYGQWTLKKLAGKCTEALYDARGRKNKISKRTIQDDIRVMRSDILGFNAPIVVYKGTYYYSDPGYSIFSAEIKEIELLREIYSELLVWWKKEKSEKTEALLEKIARITGDDPCLSFKKIQTRIISIQEKVESITAFKKQTSGYLFQPADEEYEEKETIFFWEDILNIL